MISIMISYKSCQNLFMRFDILIKCLTKLINYKLSFNQNSLQIEFQCSYSITNINFYLIIYNSISVILFSFLFSLKTSNTFKLTHG